VADSEDDAMVRISLRLPENLKTRVEQAAARAGVSINTWLIRTASAAVGTATPPPTAPPSVGQRYTGWVR
jgi:predicted HicB family RNase H-like nuclease